MKALFYYFEFIDILEIIRYSYTASSFYMRIVIIRAGFDHSKPTLIKVLRSVKYISYIAHAIF